MWKHDKESLPISDIRHLTVENLKFVLDLRKEQLDAKRKAASRAEPKKATHPAAAELEEQFREYSKDTGCKNRICMAVGEHLLHILHEASVLTFVDFIDYFVPLICSNTICTKRFTILLI
jgi:hypothetical protein